MEIPAPNPNNQDIYSLGYDKTLNREIKDASTGVVYDAVDDAVNAAQVLSGGSLNLKSLSIGGLVKQVAPGDDIQAAIDAVNREGGGTVQLLAKQYIVKSKIVMKSNVSLVGAGRDITVLDFVDSADGIISSGTANTFVENTLIKDLTIQNAVGVSGVDYYYTKYFTLENVRIFSCFGKGMRIQRCQRFRINNCIFDSNGGNGLDILGENTGVATSLIKFFAISGCSFESNTGVGLYVFQSSSPQFFQVLNCFAVSNTSHGIHHDADSNMSALFGTYNGCICQLNSGDGFDYEGFFGSVINCMTYQNALKGFYLLGNQSAFIGNLSASNTGVDYDLTNMKQSSVIGNISNPTNTGNPTDDITPLNVDQASYIYANSSSPIVAEKRQSFMKNSSGGGLPRGAVVVRSTTATGYEVTTTTTNGDNKVFGVQTLTSPSLGSTQNGLFTTEGYASVLVANSAASITVGSWLSTYSEAYYAKLAVAGDTIFAMALESPTTSTAKISAILVTPRLI